MHRRERSPDLYPRLFQIGWFTLHTYGLLVALAFLSALVLAARQGPRQGLDSAKVWDLGIVMALAGILGAKLGMFLSEREYYLEHPWQILSLSTLQSAGVWYFGLAGGALAAILMVRRYRYSFAKVADVFSPGVSFGLGIGRLGCFSAGCCWGKPTMLPWAVTFTNPYSHQVVGVPLGIPLHPTQLYEFILDMALFWYLGGLARRKSYDGQVFSTYLFLYAIGRFLIEIVRGDDEQRGFVIGHWLSTSQFIGLLCILAVLIFWWRRAGARGGQEVAHEASRPKTRS